MSLAIEPHAVPNLLLSLSFVLVTDNCSVLAKSVLLAFFPLASVNSAVGPRVFSVTLFLVCIVFAFVLLFILPGVKSDSLHLALLPLADVNASVSPCVGSKTVNHVVLPVTLVGGAILPLVETFTLSLSELVLASVLTVGAICLENLGTKAVFKAVLPIPTIA